MMGGVVSRDFGDNVTVLIAGEAGTYKYIVSI